MLNDAITVFTADSFTRSPQIGMRVAADWQEIVQWLSNPSVLAPYWTDRVGANASKETLDAAKASEGAWCWATLERGVRRKASVELVFGLGLDFDDGTTLARIVQVLGAYRMIVHSTFKSTPEAPRYRALIPYAEALPCEEHERAWITVAHHLGAESMRPDPSTKDASRLWYVPIRRPGFEYVFHVQDGRLLDGKAAAAWERPRPVAKPVDASKISDAYLRAALTRAYDRVASAKNGERNQALNNEAYSILRLPIDIETAKTALVQAAVRAGLHQGEAEKTFESAARGRGHR